MLSSTHWASVNAELLSAVLTLADLPTKIVCECVCKAWRRALRDEPDEGLWGDVVMRCDSSNTERLHQESPQQAKAFG